MLTYTAIAKNKRESVLLIFIFLIVIIALGWAFSQIYRMPEILIFAAAFSAGSALISYYFSDSITLSLSRAKPVGRESAPELYKIVENLCIAAGLPTPRIYIIDDSAPNAFATGRDPKHAVVCVTSGILQKLNKTELEGVIAHELSHIGNYDIRVMTLVVVLVGMVTLLADWLLRASFLGGRRRSDNNGGNGNIFLIVGIVLALLSPLVATLIKLAVSRQREFLADSGGALLTRYPEGLASALAKLEKDQEPLEAANKATAHLYIVNPFHQDTGPSPAQGGLGATSTALGGRSWFAKFFNTHPPLAERIQRLREMNL